MYVAKKITIDLNRPRKEVVHLGQGDSFTRWIELTLLCDGVPYDPTADLDALGIQDGSDSDIIKTVKYIKANGVPGEYEKIPENGTTPAVALMDGKTNVYIVRLDEHATDVPGFAEVFVTFYVEDSDSNVHVLHSFPITIDVVQNTTNATDPGSPYYNIHSFYVKPVGGIPASDLAPDAIGTGLSEEAKEALLACFAHVAWADEHGQEYYDALEEALYPEPEPSTLVSITADYQQDRPIYDTDDLDVIKTSDDLTVTANYSDGSSEVLDDDDYTLSGTLTVGTSTITVSYGSKTTTISVLVSSSVTTGYVAVGNPTIADNILTVENGKYVRSTVPLSPLTGQAWKVRMKLKYTTLSTAFVNIIGGSGSDSFAKTLVVQENATHQYIMYVSADKTSWTFSNMFTGQMSLSTNTWYYFELGYNGTQYYMTVKTGGWDGTVLTNGSKAAESNVLIYGGEYIGFGVNSSVSGFAGQVDLSDCSMYVGDELVWKAV